MSSWLSFDARTVSNRYRCKTDADRHIRPIPHSAAHSTLPKVNIAPIQGNLHAVAMIVCSKSVK
jgi:hypothetical protein